MEPGFQCRVFLPHVDYYGSGIAPHINSFIPSTGPSKLRGHTDSKGTQTQASWLLIEALYHHAEPPTNLLTPNPLLFLPPVTGLIFF